MVSESPAPELNPLVAGELDAWRRFGLSLVDALAATPATVEGCDAEAFRSRLAGATGGLKERPVPNQVLIASGSITQAIQHYHSQVQRHAESQRVALRSMLDGALVSLENVYGESADPLAQFRESLAEVSDLAGFPEKFKECIAQTEQKED